MAESTTSEIATEEAVVVSPLLPLGEVEFIKLSVPRIRYFRLSKSWLDVYTPVHDKMKVDMRMDYKSGELELKTRGNDTPRVMSNNLQKCADFVVAVTVGFDMADAISLLGKSEEDMDEDDVKMYFESIETKDAEIRRREHWSQAIKRVVKAKPNIEWATRTKIVIEGTMVHIIGSYLANVEIAKRSVYNHLRLKPTKLSALSNREHDQESSSSIKYWIN
ncbi:unnamed protein product [Cochlearia groenlandica]